MSVPWRLEQVEAFTAAQEKTNKELAAALATLNASFVALDHRLKVHDQSRDFWSKIWLAVACSVALGLVGFLLKISYIVQSAKLP